MSSECPYCGNYREFVLQEKTQYDPDKIIFDLEEARVWHGGRCTETFTNSEKDIVLKMLGCLGKSPVTIEQLWDHLYQLKIDPPNIDVIRQFMAKINKKLLLVGLTIRSAGHRQGYVVRKL